VHLLLRLSVAQIEIPPKEVLTKWRRAHEKHEKFRSQEEDRDVVASLHHQPIDPELRHKEFPKLAKKRIEKRATHDATVKLFEVRLSLHASPYFSSRSMTI
jgi:hypothetical protein